MFFFFRFFFLRFGRSVGFEPFDWAINMTSRAHCNQPTWTKSEDIRSNYFDLTSEYMSTPFGYRNSQKQNQTKSFWNPKSLYIRYLSKLWIVQSKLWNEYKYWYVRTHQPLSFHIHISTSEDRQWSSYTHKIAKLAIVFPMFRYLNIPPMSIVATWKSYKIVAIFWTQKLIHSKYILDIYLKLGTKTKTYSILNLTNENTHVAKIKQKLWRMKECERHTKSNEAKEKLFLLVTRWDSG